MKIFKNLLLILSFSVFIADAQTDQQQNDNLIAKIIYREHNIAKIKQDIDRLWDVCYEKVSVQNGFETEKIDERRSVSRPTYAWTKEVRRKPTCTDTDILAHRNRQNDLTKEIAAAVEDINGIIQADPTVIIACNQQGYTALNYCYTNEIYETLRGHGAHFQFLPWAYFNPITATVSIVGVTTAIVWCSYSIYKKYFGKRSDL